MIANSAYGGENVGDDAILGAIVEQLRTVMPEIQITAVTKQPEMMAERFGIETLEIMGLGNRIETYRAIARHDALILGGGALIAQYTEGARGLVTGQPGYPMTMLMMAKLLGRFAMVWGAGVEEIAYPPARFMVRHIYSRADVITVRDEDSRVRLTQSFGVDPARVITAADPVLALSVPDDGGTCLLDQQTDWNEDDAPLCVINFAWGKDRREALVDFIAAAADHVISDCGARVVFIPMNMRLDADRRGMEEVVSKMRCRDRAHILTAPYAFAEVMAIVRRAELVVSSRMHLLIFAALCCTPILGISRVPKVDAFLAHYGLSAGANTDVLDFQKFARVLDETWQQREEIAAKLDKHRETLRTKAYSSAEMFKSDLERHR
ncbi:MAG: polysaccharide pyruvyl transferase family protein [Myxococcota bacterium]|nr:polysaccharide pyruvyl transferase family protein [Myxococcota bacterium]